MLWLLAEEFWSLRSSGTLQAATPRVPRVQSQDDITPRQLDQPGEASACAGSGEAEIQVQPDMFMKTKEGPKGEYVSKTQSVPSAVRFDRQIGSTGRAGPQALAPTKGC